ncbi:MAG: hypothetical protein AUK03_08640 [Anaerolineae bacterium CG2_30_64_16]|nr:MAG: hypothetical protein AUK03_08640 [Anaerolineae bacterium CG2_30_64_16]
MKQNWIAWLKSFVRWLFGGPFRRLPPAFGNTIPPELRTFEAEADEAQQRGVGKVASNLPAPHAKTRPARQDKSLERQ